MKNRKQISRREFIRAATAAAALTPSVLTWGQSAAAPAKPSGPAQRSISLDNDWLFGGKFSAAAMQPEFDDKAFTSVTLPHTVTPLSWQNWDPAQWQDVWMYRKHFTMPPDLKNLRLFLHFDRVLANATPFVNGHSLAPHAGGFLPFDREITGIVNNGNNVLALSVDARWLSVPPAGSPRGPVAVDYLLPGGITGSAQLRA